MTASSARRTLDQQRAEHAYEAVKAAVVQFGARKSKYTTRSRDLPVMLLTSGIGQTLAFLASKTKDSEGPSPEGVLVQQLTRWLPERIGLSKAPPGGPGTWLLERLMQSDRDVWHGATREAIAYATWMKRFAEALDPDADDSGPEDRR